MKQSLTFTIMAHKV